MIQYSHCRPRSPDQLFLQRRVINSLMFSFVWLDYFSLFYHREACCQRVLGARHRTTVLFRLCMLILCICWEEVLVPDNTSPKVLMQRGRCFCRVWMFCCVWTGTFYLRAEQSVVWMGLFILVAALGNGWEWGISDPCGGLHQFLPVPRHHSSRTRWRCSWSSWSL